MLATLVHEPFDKPGWVYEEKYDGYRILAYKEGKKVTLLSRNAKDRTRDFGIVAKAVGVLQAKTLLLDGEVVVFNRRGVSRFQLLQDLKSEPRYAAFDCLYKDGLDLRSRPLKARREVLEKLVKSTAKQSTIFASVILAPDGYSAFDAAKRKGYEGVVAKYASAAYIEGRSNKWLKFKVHQEDEFIIVGYTAPAGNRKYFGALLLGAYDHGELRYVGKVGSGFTEKSLASLFRIFQPLITRKPILVNLPKERNVTYLTPRRLAQIAFEELTAGYKLRQPVFLGLRDDKEPREVTLSGLAPRSDIRQ
jgi:bifunctional non-homologous end joining protein LigD